MAVGVLSGGVTEDAVDVFVERAISHGSEQVIRTDAYSSLNVIAKKRTHRKRQQTMPPSAGRGHIKQQFHAFAKMVRLINMLDSYAASCDSF